MPKNKPRMKQFKDVKNLDSMAFVEIPQRQITDNAQYGKWLVEEVERKWMTEFNHGNAHWRPNLYFNFESGINGYIGETYISHCKFHRYDGNASMYTDRGSFVHRGFLIRDHNDIPGAAAKVQLITDNLEEFLKQEKIEYTRNNYKKGHNSGKTF